ncbi:hypothetical protein [Hymenobacter metallicola]|uniref:Uncharacterized protein n=1 Tax=Hymenobacter metallicola TaxID=2563114 RepID=A0A4Z0PYP9_9BACT|nr:hypothetical protein [Hymenobacter metallicola]TGE22900.1 hypothetical protein E5K02_21290 [Hymenobacter metallicola]
MKTLDNRLTPVASAGPSLGVLISVVAGLWFWLQLPDWYHAGHAEAAGWLTRLVYNTWTALGLIVAANVAVARYTTAPMWRLGHCPALQGMQGAFVFVLGLLFHLLAGSFGVVLLWLGAADATMLNG